MKFKYEIQNTIHFKNVIIWEKDITYATYTKSIQKFQKDVKRVYTIMESLTTMELFLSKHKLKEYDNLLMQNTTMRTKQKSLQMQPSNVMSGGI